MKRPVKLFDAELREATTGDDKHTLTGLIYNDTKNKVPDGTEITETITGVVYKDDMVISYTDTGMRYLVIKKEIQL